MLKREDMPTPETLIDYGEGGVEAAMFFYAPDDADLCEIADHNGFDVKMVALADDPGPTAADLLDEYSDGAPDVMQRWNPAMPDGWTLGAKFDGEDGPLALIIRKRVAQEDQNNG